MLSEELRAIALLRDEDLQALFLPHLDAHEIVEDVARVAFETIQSARCSNLSVLQAHLAQKCHSKSIYDDIMEAFSSVKAPILAESGRASFQAAVLFLEKYLRWRKVAMIAGDMGSQDFQKPFPVIERYDKLMKLVAPVDGSVRQLAIHSVGGVVTPAQQLMVIVPTDDPLEAEAFVENKDIGFVNAGQEAEIKIETFPYTNYGILHGELKHVSCDAINDEKRGLIYSSRVKMERTTVPVENKLVNLTSGMAVSVEIKTNKRRVIQHFRNSLLQYGSESLRER